MARCGWCWNDASTTTGSTPCIYCGRIVPWEKHGPRHVVDINDVEPEDADGGGSGLTVLEDPGNVWAPATVVAEGYRIAESIEYELRVFEATGAGTTIDDGSVFPADYPPNLAPLAETVEAVTWRYLGIVGQVSWAEAPQPLGIAVTDADGLAFTSRDTFGDSETMLRLLTALPDSGNVWEAETAVANADRIAVTVAGALRVFEATAGTTDTTEPTWNIAVIGSTTPDGTAFWAYLGRVGDPDLNHPVFQAKTDGDADWFLDQNAGAGFRFNQSIDGVLVDGSGATEITTDGFKVYVVGAQFEITYDPFTVNITGLPTSDPGVGFAGNLYTDGAPSAGVPKPLKVSGG